MCEYKVFKQRLYSPYIGEYDTWGISYLQNGEIKFVIDDVGCDEAMVQRLAQQLNGCEVPARHCMDVVLDSLE